MSSRDLGRYHIRPGNDYLTSHTYDPTIQIGLVRQYHSANPPDGIHGAIRLLLLLHGVSRSTGHIRLFRASYYALALLDFFSLVHSDLNSLRPRITNNCTLNSCLHAVAKLQIHGDFRGLVVIVIRSLKSKVLTDCSKLIAHQLRNILNRIYKPCIFPKG